MNFEKKSIEEFFLTSLLRASMGGMLLVLLSDVLIYPEDTLSVSIDAILISSSAISYFIRKKQSIISILIFTIILLLAMLYQCLAVPVNTTTSLSVILVVGFTYSILLEGKVRWTMHAITFLLLQVIFIIQFNNPELRFASSLNELITIAITYSILYTVLAYASAVLKVRYDKINTSLKLANAELYDKANEIAAQNEELIQTQDNLNELNTNLERVVNERTEKIKAQNEMLIKYSFTNAHDLRGPVARLLGLGEVYKTNSGLDRDFILTKMVEQANEIDVVIKRISADLASNKIAH